MAPFPENHIQIVDDYVSDDFVAAMRAALAAATITVKGEVVQPNDGSIESTINLRTKLRSYLAAPAFGRRLNALRTANRLLATRDFTGAQRELNGLIALGSLAPPFSLGTELSKALSRKSQKFVELVQPLPNKPPHKETHTLPGYAGLTPAERPGQRLAAWSSLVSNGPELAFRRDLLQAEIDIGLGKCDEAVRLYDGLIAAASAGSPLRKFLALRGAFARLELAGQTFRRPAVLSEAGRQDLVDLYDSAVHLLQQEDVAADNPQRQEVEARAGRRKALVQARLNYLGLWDAFVPVQKYTVLEKAADEQIRDAIASADRFAAFLKQFDDEIEKEMDVAFQKTQEEGNLSVLEKRQKNATLAADKIAEQIRAIDDQSDFFSLALGSFTGITRALVDGVEKGQSEKKEGESLFHPTLGMLNGGLGAAGLLLNFLDQREQLGHQRKVAEIEQQIAGNEVEIANLEHDISVQRIAFFQEKLDFLTDKRLNADMLYLLADINERRAERQLEAAIFLAYLFERALAFFLGEPNIRHIRFDYLDGPGGIFEAAAALQEDFRLVQHELVSVTQERADLFEEIVSLRESYPLQFNRFLQTGRMDFYYTLYQLSKRRPAAHQCRLREVGVELRGLIPPTGFSGTLTHFGRFLVRDRAATLIDPGAARLVPTDEQLAQALEEQRKLGLPVAAVGGVLFYDLELNTKQLSLNTQFVSQVPPGDVTTLTLFEGFGPTGLWRLEIEDQEALAISDVLLHFAIVSRQSDTLLLGPKVKTLIKAFEAELAGGDQLDRFSAFSLRQNFPDSFFALQNGTAGLDLAAQNFPGGLANLQFKAVIAEALDPNGRGVSGVRLTISRPEFGFQQARDTHADGFSEDLDAPPQTLPREQRFPVIGAWQIGLADAAQFARLGDVRLFFLYAFETQ